MKKHDVRCLCGATVATHGGSSYYYADDGSKVKMCSTSVSCPNCQLSLPRGKWFPTNDEAKRDALERWEKAIFPLSVAKYEEWKP